MAGIPIYARLGATIYEYRLASELTQESLAELADISPEYVSMLERGGASPTVTVLEQIANALGTDGSVLLEDAERRRSASRGIPKRRASSGKVGRRR